MSQYCNRWFSSPFLNVHVGLELVCHKSDENNVCVCIFSYPVPFVNAMKTVFWGVFTLRRESVLSFPLYFFTMTPSCGWIPRCSILKGYFHATPMTATIQKIDHLFPTCMQTVADSQLFRLIFNQQSQIGCLHSEDDLESESIFLTSDLLTTVTWSTYTPVHH